MRINLLLHMFFSMFSMFSTASLSSIPSSDILVKLRLNSMMRLWHWQDSARCPPPPQLMSCGQSPLPAATWRCRRARPRCARPTLCCGCWHPRASAAAPPGGQPLNIAVEHSTSRQILHLFAQYVFNSFTFLKILKNSSPSRSSSWTHLRRNSYHQFS